MRLTALLAGPRRRKSTHPYREQSITDALLALPPEPEPEPPAPTFTARRPVPDRETRPIPELSALLNAPVPPLPASARPEPVFTPAPAVCEPSRPVSVAAVDRPSLDVLRRVRDGLKTRWRAESFVADKRELPTFDALTRELGWQGLHMPPRPVGWRRWSTAGWAEGEQRIADAAFGAVRAQVLGELDAIQQRTAGRLTGGAR